MIHQWPIDLKWPALTISFEKSALQYMSPFREVVYSVVTLSWWILGFRSGWYKRPITQPWQTLLVDPNTLSK